MTFTDNLASEVASIHQELDSLVASLPQSTTTTTTTDYTNTQAQIAALQHEIAQTNQINNISNVTLTSPTISAPSITGLSTSQVSEGSNLYYTDARADARINATSTISTLLSAPNLTTVGTLSSLLANDAVTTNLTVTGTSTFAAMKFSTTNCSTYGNGGKLTTDPLGNVICAADQGGSGSTVAGADTQVQFNNGGTFAASSNFTFSSSTNKLTVTNASTTNLSVSGNSILGNATSTSLFSTLANFTTAIAGTLNVSVANIVGLTATNATTTNLAVTGTASTSALVASNSFTLGNLTGFLKATAGAIATSLINLTSDVTGILPVGNGGTGWSNLAAGAIPYGNGSSALATTTAGTAGNILALLNGVPTWTATTTFSSPLSFSNGAVSIPAANGSTNGYLASGDWTTFNNKLASSSLGTSALLASLVSDHTGSGSAVFATSPTFAGTPVFGGGVANYSVNSTTTIPNGTPYAWTVATSTSATPLIEVDTSGSTGSVQIGAASSSGSSVVFGATGEPANLVFAASSTIEGAGTGQLITLGANSDVVNFGVNVGIGTTSPDDMFDVRGNGTNDLAEFYNGTGGSVFKILNNGNIGIGTTTPGSIFSVQGVANWTGATTTYYSTGGINLTGGCFSINGTCISGSGGSSASSTLLSDNNTFSGINSFTNASSNFGGTWQTFSPSHFQVAGTGTSGNCVQWGAANTLGDTGAPCGGSGSTPGGSSGQIQFNSSNTFGGASNLFWDSTSNRLGIGTSSPFGELSVATPNGASGSVTTLFAVASSTNGTATTTLFSIDNKGDTIHTLAASSTFAVGPNGLTNPAFQILASTTNSATGLELVSNMAGNGVFLNTISSSANEMLTIQSTGTGHLELNGGLVDLEVSGSQKITAASTYDTFNAGGHNSNVGGDFNFNAGTDPGISASTENNFVNFNLGSGTHTHANGALSLQRDFAILPATHAFNTFNGGANNIATLDTAYIGGAPLLGNNGTSTNENTLYLAASALNASTTNSYGLTANANTGAKNNYAAEFLGGNVGINTTAPGNYLAISTSTNLGTISLEYNGASQNAGGFNNNDNGSASQTVFNFLRNNTAVGTISETNTATAYNTTSDRRLKEDIATTTRGLDILMQLPVRDFDFINDPTHAKTTGFIAQELLPIFPAAVTTNGDNGVVPLGATSTPWSVDYGRITPLIVKAVQDIANISSTFQQNLIAWLGNANNGIHDLYATVIHAHQVTADELCAGTVCVNQQQLAAVLAAANQSPAGNSSTSGNTSTSSAITDTPPVLQINGDNPAHIQIGDSYNDLGATITGPQADLNLGITTYVNGIQMTPVQITTTQAATDTIDYVVTDSAGNSATSTRTVIVQAPIAAPPTSGLTASTTESTASTTASQ